MITAIQETGFAVRIHVDFGCGICLQYRLARRNGCCDGGGRNESDGRKEERELHDVWFWEGDTGKC
jgi:hypothetical protein